ncbi:MAG: sel1 repeat family protein [Hyphomicrobiales bacterium]|nr:sel1 repeat family protein [Hyphomicrobiales bacterium]
MAVRTYRSAPGGARRSVFVRGLAAALALAAACLASNANAGAMSAGMRAYQRHNYVLASQLLLAEAERGSPTAQTYLGYMYQYGVGVPRNYEVSVSWLNQAAQQGEPTAQFLLGLLFDKGYGVPMDWVQAEVWLSLAAAHAPERQRDYWTRVRDAVAQKLTLDQIAEAQRRAFEWAPIVVRVGPGISARY